MTDIFVSWAAPGDDANTGLDRTLPKKTITSATTGRTGNDHIKCAASPAATALSGTLTFTKDSVTVNTSVDLSAEVAANDFIRPNSGSGSNLYWKVVSVNGGAKTITLTFAFRGTTVTNGAATKLNATNCLDTGAAAAATTQVQAVSASGTSASSKLQISGGWDLSQNPPVQTGETWFYQSGGTTLNGYGLYGSSSINYITIDKLNFLNYNYDFFVGELALGTNIAISNSIAVSNNGLQLCAQSSTIVNCERGALNLNGRTYKASYLGTVTNCKWANGFGLTWEFGDILFDSCTCLGAAADVMYPSSNSTGPVTFIDCDFGNMNLVLYPRYITEVKFYNCSNIGIIYSSDGRINNYIKFKKFNTTTNDDRAYGTYGYLKKNTAAAQSGSCVEIIPSSATYYFYFQRLIAVAASTDRSISVYMKKSADFNGTVEASLWWKGEIIDGWDTWAMTTSYVAQTTLTGPSGSIDEDGVMELRIRVTGTAGSVYADDMS